MILRKFGFKVNKNTNKIIPVDQWLKTMAEDYFKNDDGDDFNFDSFVRKNHNLLDYLSILVKYINANPGILNKHYVASDKDIQDYIKEELDRYSVSTDQPPYFVWVNNNNSLYNYDNRAYPIMKGGRKKINKNALRFLLKNSSKLMVQYGGNYETNTTNKIRQNTTSRLKKYLDYVIKIADTQNISVDRHWINQKIDKMGVYEKKILNALATIEKYVENNKTFGDGEAVSLLAMENYLDRIVKYTQSSQQLENSVINKINDITNMINDSNLKIHDPNNREINIADI